MATGKIVDAVAHPGAAESITPLILGMGGIIVVGSAAVYVRTSQLGIISEQVWEIVWQGHILGFRQLHWQVFAYDVMRQLSRR